MGNEILTQASTRLLSDQADALRFNDELDLNTNTVTDICRQKCVLGASACKLTLTNEEVTSNKQLIVQATCVDCPNPEVPQQALSSLVDFAERRVAAIMNVKLFESSVSMETETFFRLYEDPEQGEIHLISAESLDSLIRDERETTSRVPAALLRSLQNQAESRNHVISENARRAIFISDKLANIVGSRTPIFIIAERIEDLVTDAGLEAVDNIGQRAMELLRATYQTALEAGYVKRPNPLDSMLIEEMDLGVRSYNLLKRAGVQTVADLVAMTEARLDSIEYMGERSKEDVISNLRALGLSLAGPAEPDVS